jgi:hypothetical protein
MTPPRLKYVKLDHDAVLAFLRTRISLPDDTKIRPEMAYDKETGSLVCLLESEEFPEVTGPDALTEILL